MPSFSARLRKTGQSRILLGVLVDVTDETITVTSADREVAKWSLDEIDISHLPDGFHINCDGEEVVLGVTESNRFASALGVGARHERSAAPGIGRRSRESLLHRSSMIAGLTASFAAAFAVLQELRP